MYAYIKGKLEDKDPPIVVIDCNGLGYEIRVSMHTYTQIEKLKEVKLFVYLQVKEDAHTLYGFYKLQEKALFVKLISISGVGANTAIVILSSMTVGELYEVIGSGDVNSLKKIKGIGAKTAGRIVLELKDKLSSAEGIVQSGAGQLVKNKMKEEALAALMQLGYAKSTIEKRIDAVMKTGGNDLTVSELIRQVLKNQG